VIRSCSKMNYDTAQEFIDAASKKPNFQLSPEELRAAEAKMPETAKVVDGHTTQEVITKICLLHKSVIALFPASGESFG
jgi:hypothetical protein